MTTKEDVEAKLSFEEIEEEPSRAAQLRRWVENPPEWLHNVEFETPNAREFILDAPEVEPTKSAAPRIPKDLPPYLRSLYLTPLLSRELERDLFRRYNFSKYLLAKLLGTIDPETATQKDFESVQALKRSVDEYRHRITRANLRLVVSIAKRHVGRASNFFEVVSDGNMSLILAIEKFDYSRGTKFSTYATWAIMKNYARLIPESHNHSSRFVTGQDLALELATDAHVETAWESDRRDVRELIEAGLIELSEREREILRGRFGLGDAQEQPVTLERLGRRFGMTKERVRQIERRAIARLRETLSPRLAESI
jgi:RNA polymerase primary sigma factor